MSTDPAMTAAERAEAMKIEIRLRQARHLAERYGLSLPHAAVIASLAFQQAVQR